MNLNLPSRDSRYYKAKKLLSRFTVRNIFLDSAASLVTVFIGVLAYSEHPTWVYVLGGIYVTITATGVYLTIGGWESDRNIEYWVFHDFFQYMNQKLFDGKQGHRYTLFTVDSVYPDYLTPYVRFTIGETLLEAATAAEKSRAIVPRKCGYVGIAWEKPESLIYREFPVFGSRDAYIAYCTDVLHFPRSIVENTSPYMYNVRSRFCWGILDGERRSFLGVLSIDSKDLWGSNDNSSSIDPQERLSDHMSQPSVLFDGHPWKKSLIDLLTELTFLLGSFSRSKVQKSSAWKRS